MTHLLVTNDFPPKAGGIQAYLWELWRRLPAESFAVLTTAHPGARGFDAEQPFRVERVSSPVLLPTPALARRIDGLAADVGASLVVVDPALPLGLVGERLRVPYAVVLHGAEIVVPSRLPVTGRLLRRVLGGARGIIAAGGYPGLSARSLVGPSVPIEVVPPGVDVQRFTPVDDAARQHVRRRWGLPATGRLVVSVSRLVPRKGMDVLVQAAAALAPPRPDLVVAIAGTGRDRRRIERLIARTGAPVVLLGAVTHEELPGLYACADVFAMLARSRWGGLEEEGFGIVYLEAAACGVPQVAGASGGTTEAVADGTSGIVVWNPHRPDQAAGALATLLDDEGRRAALGAAARRRAVDEFAYDALAPRLDAALGAWR